MKLITEALLDTTSQKAKQSDRKRMNYNFHPNESDVLNRLLNALEPQTYIPPHRHKNPDKEEIFLVLRGSLAFFTFDEDGTVLSSTLVSPQKGVYGMEIDACVWHSLVVLEENTIVYEIKEGPYAPLQAENFAPWAPAIDNARGIEKYNQELLGHIEKAK
jgi:cupin fold WbuC family metalloprotein